MKKRYFVWKDANCNGVNPEWIELSGKEFCGFQQKPENKNRYFAKLAHPELDDECYVMECTFNQYVENNKEVCKQRRSVMRKIESGIIEVSYTGPVSNDPDLTYEDVIADEDVNVELTVIQKLENEELYKAIKTLSDDEQQIICAYYLNNEDKKGEREIAKEFGLPQKTFNYRKQVAIKKLQKFFAQN